MNKNPILKRTALCLTAVMAFGSLAVHASALPFTDVPADAYYYDSVQWAVEHEVTKGTSDTAFSPDNGCIRAEVVTFLWRSCGSPEAGRSMHSDVPADRYYTQPVGWAVANGITKGTSPDKFSPYDPCTRSQIVTFLYRAKDLIQKPAPEATPTEPTNPDTTNPEAVD